MATPSRYARGLRTGLGSDTAHRSVVPPVHLSTNYVFDGLDGRGAYDYSRSGNPTRDLLGGALADLEGGAGAVVTGSGMAALTLAVNAFVPAGGRVVAPHDCYGGCWRQLVWLADKGILRVDFVDLTDPDVMRQALATPTDLLLVETPSNPLLRVTDLALAVELGHAAGARVLVDNTFCSPAVQRPLDSGADMVMHSTTKFLNGHSDVMGGALVSATEEDATTAALWANCLGLTSGALDSYLTLRGLRTLDVRMRAHQASAEALLEVFTSHPAVARVHHTSLPDHPGHELAGRQQRGGHSPLTSIELTGGRPAVDAFLDGLEVFWLAESLGGVESLVCHPSTMTHASMPPEVQAAAGLSDGLLRFSVGIEETTDLVADVTAALQRAQRAS